jgi:hypothetical protein
MMNQPTSTETPTPTPATLSPLDAWVKDMETIEKEIAAGR